MAKTAGTMSLDHTGSNTWTNLSDFLFQCPKHTSKSLDLRGLAEKGTDHEGLRQGLKYFCLHVPDVHQLAPASSSNARLKQH
jgi:hypothetical protein